VVVVAVVGVVVFVAHNTKYKYNLHLMLRFIRPL
jgi:hypothetical protein